MKELPINYQCWVSKYISGHFATGKNMQWWLFQSSAQCPRCHKPQEDKYHIMTCPATAAQEWWEKLMKELELWLRDKNMDRDIHKQLMFYLRNWTSLNLTMLAPTTPHGSTKCNWKTAHLGWMAQLGMERTTRTNLETDAVQEIKPMLDFGTH